MKTPDDDQQTRLPNMRDVARAANVSLITVSRALREPTKVREDTRGRIQAAIEQISYVPHLAARSLQNSRSNIVALLLPSLQNSAFAATAHGLFDVLEPEGYQLIVGGTGDFQDPALEERLVAAFLGRRPDAFVITGTRRTSHTQKLLERAKIPVVNIWNKRRQNRFLAVGPDNRGAAALMTQGLFERGYRNVGYLGGHSEWNDIVLARRQGYLDAVERQGAEPAKHMMKELRAPADLREIGDAFVELLAQAPDIDAIFCPGDHYAIAALLRANAEKIAVPQRVAIAGFGDLELAAALTPALTTVHVDAYKLGQITGRQILSALTGKLGASPKVIEIGHEIVWRAST